MDLAALHEAGYCPVPLRGGRPWASGLFSNTPSWRYAHADDGARFADCEAGILCSAKPLHGAGGAATLSACASTWVAGISWETTDRKLATEIGDTIERIAGAGPARYAGAEITRVFRCDAPFPSRRMLPHYFPKERHTEPAYRPHRLAVLSMASWIPVEGGRWTGGALPKVRRDALPVVTAAQADRIITDVEALLRAKGALPWI